MRYFKTTCLHFKTICLLAWLHFLNFTIADITNLRFFGVWMDAAASNAFITKFESTLVIPMPSPDSNITNDIEAFWPGLEDISGASVLQPVITNQGAGPGEWFLLPFYCCNPTEALQNQMRVWPEDTVTNTLSLDIPSGQWYVNWIVTPGATGNAGGQVPFGGGVTFDPKTDYVTHGAPYAHALMTIELQQLGTWDFGDVVWRNIMVQANTTDAKWCMQGPQDVNDAAFNYTFTPPTVTTLENTTICYIAQLTFHQPGLGPFIGTELNSTVGNASWNGTVGPAVWTNSSRARRSFTLEY